MQTMCVKYIYTSRIIEYTARYWEKMINFDPSLFIIFNIPSRKTNFETFLLHFNASCSEQVSSKRISLIEKFLREFCGKKFI